MTKRNKIIYWITTIWLSLGMISTGIAQLMRQPTGAGGGDSIAQLGYPLYLLTLLGVGKILGVIAVLIPGKLLLKEWTYAGFFFLMTGAIFSHFAIENPVKEILPALLLWILTLISWYFRPPSRKFNFVQS